MAKNTTPIKTVTEILLESKNAQNFPLTNYIVKDSYVWHMIELAMQKHTDQFLIRETGINRYKTKDLNPGVSGWYHTDKGKLYYFSKEENHVKNPGNWSCRDDQMSEEYPEYWYRDSFAVDIFQTDDFETAVRPLLSYLCRNHNPHTSVIVTPTCAEVVQGVQVFKTDDYLVD